VRVLGRDQRGARPLVQTDPVRARATRRLVPDVVLAKAGFQEVQRLQHQVAGRLDRRYAALAARLSCAADSRGPHEPWPAPVSDRGVRPDGTTSRPELGAGQYTTLKLPGMFDVARSTVYRVIQPAELSPARQRAPASPARRAPATKRCEPATDFCESPVSGPRSLAAVAPCRRHLVRG